jgi:hypothetical protein
VNEPDGKFRLDQPEERTVPLRYLWLVSSGIEMAAFLALAVMGVEIGGASPWLWVLIGLGMSLLGLITFYFVARTVEAEAAAKGEQPRARW